MTYTFVAFSGSITNYFMASCTYVFGAKRGSATLGVIKNETLVFVNFFVGGVLEFLRTSY